LTGKSEKGRTGGASGGQGPCEKKKSNGLRGKERQKNGFGKKVNATKKERGGRREIYAVLVGK